MQAGSPASLVRTTREVLRMPVMRERGMLQPTQVPGRDDPVTLVNAGVVTNADGPGVQGPVPALGGDTDAVLSELGYSPTKSPICAPAAHFDRATLTSMNDHQPLADVKIVDLTRHALAGAAFARTSSSCSAPTWSRSSHRALATTSANVPPPSRPSTPANARWCLDLKSERGHQALSRLVARSDVLVENYRPGVTEKLGVDWPSMQALNANLIYCSVTGYGQTWAAAQLSGDRMGRTSHVGYERQLRRGRR